MDAALDARDELVVERRVVARTINAASAPLLVADEIEAVRLNVLRAARQVPEASSQFLS